MGKIQLKYKELFSLSIQQPFYENGIHKKVITEPVNDFLLMPTDDCQKLMNKLGFIWKAAVHQAGCIVLASVSTNPANDTIVRYPGKDSDKLSFWMILQNPDLLNFNDLPLSNDTDKIWYFSNEISDPGAPRNNLHLTIDTSGVDAANDRLKKSPANYNYHHGAVVPPHRAFVKHLLTEMMVPARAIVNHAGQADISFDLSPLPVGKCKLIISGADVDSFYYVGTSVPPSLFGVIEILLTPSLEPNYRMLEAGNIITRFRPFYTIRLNNRKTIWRYTIELAKNSPLYLDLQRMTDAERDDFIDHFNISTNDPRITFTQTLFNDTVFEFKSNDVIAMREKYVSSSANKTLRLELKKNDIVVRDYLPFPSNSLVNALNAPPTYSDIFITI